MAPQAEPTLSRFHEGHEPTVKYILKLQVYKIRIKLAVALPPVYLTIEVNCPNPAPSCRVSPFFHNISKKCKTEKKIDHKT